MKKLLAALLCMASLCAFAALDPFRPAANGSVTIAVTSSSAATALTTSGFTVRPAIQVMVDNAGAQPVFIEFGTSGVAAVVATSMRDEYANSATRSCSAYIATGASTSRS